MSLSYFVKVHPVFLVYISSVVTPYVAIGATNKQFNSSISQKD